MTYDGLPVENFLGHLGVLKVAYCYQYLGVEMLLETNPGMDLFLGEV